MKILFLLLTIAFLISCERPPTEVERRKAPAPTQIIPGERLAPWQGNIGVPGGIPNRITIFKTLSPSGSDDGPQINQAIKDCPANQVVLLNAGTFQITTGISQWLKQNFTLRGAGQGRTILRYANGTGNVISLRGTSPWPPPQVPYPVVSGATKGSTVLTLSDTSAFTPNGTVAIVTSPIPSWGHNLGFQGSPSTDSSQTYGVTFRVVSKTSTTVTIEPPCPYDFTTISNRQIVAIPYTNSAMITGVGVESMTLDCTGSQDFSATQFEQTWGCWIKDVEVKGSYSRQMYFLWALRNEVRNCYVHDVQAVGPNHEGIAMNADCSWNWVEDNITSSGGAPAIEFSDGTHKCSCNVASYNYCINPPPNFWDISFSHGSGGMLNLAEGNKMTWFKDDGYFGGSGQGTLLRNQILFQVSLKHFTVYSSAVGNVIGESGQAKVYETEESSYYSKNLVPIWELGFPNIGNDQHSGTFFGPTNPPDYSGLPNLLEGTQQLDRNVKATLLRHGNWDNVNKTVIWDQNIADRTIPVSFIYGSKPSWWGNLPWPAIGPDLNPMIGVLPAEQRYKGSPTPPPNVTPTATATNTPIPSVSPTATATSTRTPTPAPSPTAVPSVSPTPAPSPSAVPTPYRIIVVPGQQVIIEVQPQP